MCKRNPSLGPPGPAYTWREMLGSLSGVLGVLILFLLVIGGLFGGVFTPSEAGAMGAFGAFVIALVKRQITFSSLGFDLIWFGIVLTLLGELGNITPPVGMNAYVVQGVTKVPLEEVFRGITPFAVAMLVGLIALYIFPQITLFLPGVMG